MYGEHAPMLPALETLFLPAQARWEVSICDCYDVCSLAPALPALESLFPQAPARWEWAGVSVMVRCDCPGRVRDPSAPSAGNPLPPSPGSAGLKICDRSDSL